MKTPIPAPAPNFRQSGTASTIISLILRRVSSVNMTPAQKTIPRASGHGTPIAPQMPKLKRTFSPMPGASAIG
jgi:hypothetical protein